MACTRSRVAPLAGSVDRNPDPPPGHRLQHAVAPLAGSVDRNTTRKNPPQGGGVAPLAGSVDRNIEGRQLPPLYLLSLPSRGVWIEIAMSMLRAAS